MRGFGRIFLNFLAQMSDMHHQGIFITIAAVGPKRIAERVNGQNAPFIFA